MSLVEVHVPELAVERMLALLERLVVAVEALVTFVVKRNAPSLPTSTHSHSAFPVESASGERLTPFEDLPPGERKKVLARIRAKAYRANVKLRSQPTPSMPAPAGPQERDGERDGRDAPGVLERDASVTERDASERDDRHVSSRLSVTRHAAVGGGGGVFQGLEDEKISPISPISGSRRDLNARDGASRSVTGVTVPESVTGVTGSVTVGAPDPAGPALVKTSRSPTDDGCFGMAVSAFCEGIRSVTKKDYLPPRGSELNLLVDLMEAHEKDPEKRIDWARRNAREFAQTARGKLNLFAFKDFVQSPRAVPRVQSAPQGKRRWRTAE